MADEAERLELAEQVCSGAAGLGGGRVSAPLRLTSKQLVDLGKFLDALTEATHSTGCSVTPYGPITVSVGDNHGVQVSWVEAEYQGEYVVDDRVGS